MTVPAFGDNVCIADTPITREMGFAGQRGAVFRRYHAVCYGD